MLRDGNWRIISGLITTYREEEEGEWESDAPVRLGVAVEAFDLFALSATRVSESTEDLARLASTELESCWRWVGLAPKKERDE